MKSLFNFEPLAQQAPPLPIQPASGRIRLPLPVRNILVPPTAVTSGSLAGQPTTSRLYRLFVL